LFSFYSNVHDRPIQRTRDDNIEENDKMRPFLI